MSKRNGSSKPQKKPVIRKGNFRPFKKCTQEEKQRRMDLIADWLNERPILDGKLKKRIRQEFDLDFRQAAFYIASVKEKLLERLGRTKDEWRIESLSFYEKVIRAADATYADKTRARERVDKLLGLDMPSQMEVKHSGGVVHTDSVDIASLNLPIETRKLLLEAVREKYNPDADTERSQSPA